MGTAKWVRKLTKRELRHLAEVSASGRPTLQSLKANLQGQHQNGIHCFECESIARKLAIPVSTANA